MLQGFECTFTFKVGDTEEGKRASPIAEGFAFVMQSESANAQGISDYNIGYGGLRRSIAIEFDMLSNTATSDPDYQHVAVQIPKDYSSSDTNSAVHSLTGNVPSTSNEFTKAISFFDRLDPNNTLSGPELRMDNGTEHRVRIEYAPWLRAMF